MAQIGESGCDTSTDWSPGALSADCLRDQDKLDFCGGGGGVSFSFLSSVFAMFSKG